MDEVNKRGEVLIEVEGLSKKFCKDLKTSLWYGAKDIVKNIMGNKPEAKLRPKEFWAVKDINFKLKRGECLGLIGHNGAGKSTLLKMLNGLINPDEGKIVMRGRVGALIELGAGFNPILTGRENIYNNGAVLGFTRDEINAKMQDIIDFCEIEEFLDMPVQNYSSGMKVRLGFAVAAQMEPDILIIDEVLAVGDLGFILKCFKTIDKILPKTAVVFVSHNMPMVSRVCTKIILMEKGQSLYQGNNTSKAIDKYYQRFVSNKTNNLFDDGSLSLLEVDIANKIGVENNLAQVKWGSDLSIRFKFKINKKINIPVFNIIIFDKEQRPVAIFEKNDNASDLLNKNGQLEFMVSHKNIQLSKGIYSINIAATDDTGKNPHLRINNLISFQMLHPEEIWQPFLLKASYINI